MKKIKMGRKKSWYWKSTKQDVLTIPKSISNQKNDIWTKLPIMKQGLSDFNKKLQCMEMCHYEIFRVTKNITKEKD